MGSYEPGKCCMGRKGTPEETETVEKDDSLFREEAERFCPVGRPEGTDHSLRILVPILKV
jgi:hypothetical protein